MYLDDLPVFSSSVIIPHPELKGAICAVTRPLDRGIIPGTCGLDIPGGKLNPGEDVIAGAVRETYEEGFQIFPENVIEVFRFYSKAPPLNKPLVTSFLVSTKPAIKLEDYKEKYRGVIQIPVAPITLSVMWFGNRDPRLIKLAEDLVNGKPIKPINLTSQGWYQSRLVTTIH